jgi:DNA-binding LytR/AlgR family response regulator
MTPTEPTKLRIVVADDERPARAFLISALRTFGDVEIAGEAANGVEALRQIESLHPDVVFLDIQMPELDGIEVAGLLQATKPYIVFTTAHLERVTDAQELHVVGSLLKPVDGVALRAVLNRVHELFGHQELFHETRNINI